MKVPVCLVSFGCCPVKRSTVETGDVPELGLPGNRRPDRHDDCFPLCVMHGGIRSPGGEVPPAFRWMTPEAGERSSLYGQISRCRVFGFGIGMVAHLDRGACTSGAHKPHQGLNGWSGCPFLSFATGPSRALQRRQEYPGLPDT